MSPCTLTCLPDNLQPVKLFWPPHSLQVFSYVLPVLASAGSILVGGIVTVVVSSKTEELDSLLKSLNDPARRRYSSGSTPNPLRSELVQSKPADTDASRQSDTMLTDGAFEAGENIYSQPGASNVPSTGAIGAVGLGDRLLLLMVLALSLLFAYCSALVGSSDLLGCFLGGVALSGIPGVQRVWARQVCIYTIDLIRKLGTAKLMSSVFDGVLWLNVFPFGFCPIAQHPNLRDRHPRCGLTSYAPPPPPPPRARASVKSSFERVLGIFLTSAACQRPSPRTHESG